ncbi:hypothetical protein [Roseibium sp. TrichSKD4]|uniref:hypothetical protein n=1 Tax=Roseibium sp. TrichSKD4 TaxID=744980 RepID=UPI000590BA53|nr:hypothetical protein [Roseibium sp. TrichSKD4]
MKFDPYKAIEIKVSPTAHFFRLIIETFFMLFFIFAIKVVIESPFSILTIPAVILSFIMSLYFLFLLPLRIKSLRTKAPAILIGPEGFLDTRVINKPIRWNEIESIKIFSFARVYLIAISTNEKRNLNHNFLNLYKPFLKLKEPNLLLYPIGGLSIRLEEFDEHISTYEYYWNNPTIKENTGLGKTFFELHARHTSEQPDTTWETHGNFGQNDNKDTGNHEKRRKQD